MTEMSVAVGNGNKLVCAGSAPGVCSAILLAWPQVFLSNHQGVKGCTSPSSLRAHVRVTVQNTGKRMCVSAPAAQMEHE